MKRWLLILFISGSFPLVSCVDGPSDPSSGGESWVWHPVLTGSALNAVADDGTSYAVVGAGARRQISVDGRSWSVTSAGDGDNLWDVVATREGWVYVGESGHVGVERAAVSEATTIPGGHDLHGIAASDSILVVVGEDGFIASAPVWNDWTERASPTQATLEDVRWNGDVFVAVGGSGAIVVSPDGISWSEVQSPTGNDLNAVTVGPLGTWLAVGPAGTVVRSQQADASAWQGVIETRTLALNDVVWTGSRFVSIGPGGYIGESSDNGRTWYKESSNTTEDLRRLVSSHGRLLAVGTGTSILLSEEPGSWESVNPGAKFQSSRAIWTGSRFVVEGRLSILTSLDGSEWLETYPESTLFFVGIAHSPDMLVAAAVETAIPHHGAMLGSSDGAVWTPIPGALDQSYRDVAWGNPGFLAISNGLEGAMSIDGHTWTRVALPVDFYRVIWGGETYLALGENTIGLSANGTDWEYVPYPFPVDAGTPNDVDWVDGQFFIAGPDDRISTSADGRNWNVHMTGTGIDILAVTRKGPGIYATGGYGTILMSSDFLIWREQQSGTTHQLLDLTASDRAVLAVGESGTMLTQP